MRKLRNFLKHLLRSAFISFLAAAFLLTASYRAFSSRAFTSSGPQFVPADTPLSPVAAFLLNSFCFYIFCYLSRRSFDVSSLRKDDKAPTDKLATAAAVGCGEEEGEREGGAGGRSQR